VAHGNEADGHTGYRSNIGKAEGQFHQHQNARDAEKCSNAPACARSGTVRVLPLKIVQAMPINAMQQTPPQRQNHQ